MARFECLVCGAQRQHRKDAFRHVRDNHPGHKDREEVVEVDEDEVHPPPASRQAGSRGAARRVLPSVAPAAAIAPSLPLAAVAPTPAPSTSNASLRPASPRPLYEGAPVANFPFAQLRSSRSTRNQDHNPAARNRPGVADHDPTEGLPVQRFERRTVRIDQDATADPGEAGRQESDVANEQYQWPQPGPGLPTYFKDLAPWNQEFLVRSRQLNPNPILSEWDRKTETWIPGIELERREAARKAALNKPKSTTGADLAEDLDDDKPDEDADDLLDADGMPAKRRKTGARSTDRIIEVKKWMPIPPAIAEKMPEPKYLADRRPGMESLYKGAYKATNGYGTLGDMGDIGAMVAAAMSGGTTGYNLGEGGLARAQGMLAPGSGSLNINGTNGMNMDGTTTPARKNIPPRRKKKGGPGRKPKNWKPETAATGATSTTTTDAITLNTTQDTTNNIADTGTTTGEGADTLMQDTPAETGERIDNITTGEGDGEGSESESEGEGSEEGEIAANESVHVTEDVVPEKDEADKGIDNDVDNAADNVASLEVGGDPEANVAAAVPVAPEIDVLGALEAALDEEAGQDV